jgi:uncharacterized protein (TIGR03437 family)
MKKTGGFLTILLTLALLALGTQVKAETLTGVVKLSTNEEVGSTVPLPVGATGTTLLTVVVTRDASGNVTGGSVNFLTNFNFPGGVTLTGHHIHEGVFGANGPIIIDPPIAGVQTQFPTGAGMVSMTATITNLDAFKRFLANPAGFYVNFHTSANPAGAIRGQVTNLIEKLAVTVDMSTASEVPPITDLTASGTGTITIVPTRNSVGEVTGGTVTFTVDVNFPGPIEFTGLHIHEQVAGVNGPVVINTGISNTARVSFPSGRGVINIPVAVTGGNPLAALRRLLANPTGFYVNLHTVANPGGVIRGQLTALSTTPPMIFSASSFIQTTNSMQTLVRINGTGFDAGTVILVNGQLAVTGSNPETRELTVVIPTSALMNPGPLFLQARQNTGLRSLPIVLPVVAPTNINQVTAVIVDSARFGPTVAPGSIASIFGTNLATQTVSSSQMPLPTTLGGTTVYVNGVAAPLFYVSPTQINFQVPSETATGTATVIVVNGNGVASQGVVQVANAIPALFTTNATGTGAAAGVASATGTNFNLILGQPNGTTVAVPAGSFVMIFGTGLRFGSALPTLTIGGVNVTPTFSGPQGGFVGLDQLNFQIPASLAGRGEVDLTITIDGRTSNVVRLRIQ